MDEKPNATLSGTVEMIIKSPLASEPERAQIAVEGAGHPYMQIRIENTLTDESGEEVHMKPGAKVKVTVRSRAARRRRVRPCRANSRKPPGFALKDERLISAIKSSNDDPALRGLLL